MEGNGSRFIVDIYLEPSPFVTVVETERHCVYVTLLLCLYSDVARRQNMRSWLYRIRPSVTDAGFCPSERVRPEVFGANFEQDEITCNQLRWLPVPLPDTPVDFIQGLQTICGAGRYVSHEVSKAETTYISTIHASFMLLACVSQSLSQEQKELDVEGKQCV